MYCTICTALDRGATWALFALVNETTGDLALLSMQKPDEIDFQGNSAEWVVEALSEENLFGELTVLPLADFGAVYFDEGVAGTNRNNTVNVGDMSATLVFLNGRNSNQLLSEPTVENDHLIKVTRVNPYDPS